VVTLALARIDEARCIGCTLCIDACPVDAILGAPKRMHVVMSSLCTGCELCLAPCPVDCIVLEPAMRPWTPADAHDARERHDQRAAREDDPGDRASVVMITLLRRLPVRGVRVLAPVADLIPCPFPDELRGESER